MLFTDLLDKDDLSNLILVGLLLFTVLLDNDGLSNLIYIRLIFIKPINKFIIQLKGVFSTKKKCEIESF